MSAPMCKLRPTHIVLINGPPRAGKDTLATALVQAIKRAAPYTEVVIDRFAKSLNDAIIAAHALTPAAYAHLEANKDKPSELLYGRSLREARIAMGERYFKHLYGQEIAGKLLMERIRARQDSRDRQIVIVPDLGFDSETVPLLNSTADISVIRVTRNGADYSKDSRGFVDTLGVQLHVANDGTIEDITALADVFVKERLKLSFAPFVF